MAVGQGGNLRPRAESIFFPAEQPHRRHPHHPAAALAVVDGTFHAALAAAQKSRNAGVTGSPRGVELFYAQQPAVVDPLVFFLSRIALGQQPALVGMENHRG